MGSVVIRRRKKAEMASCRRAGDEVRLIMWPAKRTGMRSIGAWRTLIGGQIQEEELCFERVY
jgi:hypothetical protein